MGGGQQVPMSDSQSAAAPHPREMNVLVTGFGPFPDGMGGHFDKNASHLIVRSLPTSLPKSHSLNTSSVHINIINPCKGANDYIPTEYAAMRKRVHELHEQYAGKVDLFLHVGMAMGWHWMTVERYAYKEGFSSTWWSGREEEKYHIMPDDKGQTIDDLGPSPWAGVPMGLDTQINVDGTVEGANKGLVKFYKDSEDAEDRGHHRGEHGHSKKPIDIIPHHEGGSYGCGFTYFESLANCYVQTRKRDVLFCHTPGETDDESIRKGKEGILAVIGSAMDQLVLRKAAEQVMARIMGAAPSTDKQLDVVPAQNGLSKAELISLVGSVAMSNATTTQLEDFKTFLQNGKPGGTLMV